MQLQQYIHMLKRSWWIIVLAGLVALNVALALSYLATPLYRSTARLIVSPGPSLLATENKDLIDSLDLLDKRSVIATYAEIINSRTIYNEVWGALQISSGNSTDFNAEAVVLPEASALELSVEGPDPEIAASLANNIANRAIERIRVLYQIYDIHLLDPATPSTEYFSPRPLRNAGVALVLGLVFGGVLALLREYLPAPIETAHSPLKKSETSLPLHSPQSFYKLLEQELGRSEQGALSLGLVQLNGLDEFLGELSPSDLEQLKTKITEILTTTLPDEAVVGWWNDITFAILLPGTTGQAAFGIVEHVRQALSQPLTIGDPDYKTVLLNPHAGITTFDGNEATNVLIDQVETALKYTSLNGNKTVLFPVNNMQMEEMERA